MNMQKKNLVKSSPNSVSIGYNLLTYSVIFKLHYRIDITIVIRKINKAIFKGTTDIFD